MIPVELQVLGSGLRAIAEEMGAVLIRSAFSANIKERRDCSTALFDEAGRMVVQAEHIPVHLGAMPEAVAAVRAHDPARAEPWILNDPYAGGTHLPDLTIVTRTNLGYAVTRAHHADVGGSEPGSLPSDSRTLEEEGEADLRYRGQSFELTVRLGPALVERFHRAHEERYGYADRSRPLELVAVRPADVVPGPEIELPPGEPFEATGPAVAGLAGATCWIPPGWVGVRDGNSTLILTRS